MTSQSIQLLLTLAMTSATLSAVADTVPETEAPLTALRGRSEQGAALFADRDKGHCVLCHRLQAHPAPFQGTVGPALDDIGARLDAGRIRYLVVDASRRNPETVMPPYFRVDGLSRVAEAWRGKPLLAAQEVEDIVAYLAAQR